MLQSIKRWFSSGAGSSLREFEEWAQQRGLDFKRSREGDGFIVESGRGTLAGWRLEWGPSQRPYILGTELRLRAELGGDLQMLLLSRPLMETMEKAVFESYTIDLQTRADSATPEEMRWLVLFPKLPNNELKGLREGFGAVGSLPKWLGEWVAGIAEPLMQAYQGWLAVAPVAFIVQRGRLTMRVALGEPTPARLDEALALFEPVRREALRVTQAWLDHGSASTMPSLWSADSRGG